MACLVDLSFRREFPNTVVVPFFSSSEYAPVQTGSHIPDATDGYLQSEMEVIGQAAADINHNELVASPYPTRLRPLANLNDIYSSQRVFLEKVEFFCYDTTLQGSTYQDADTLNAIYGSKTGNDVYAQSLYKNGMPNNWQPNFFRPIFKVDDKNIFHFLQNTNFGGNKGDLSIGLPLPYCFDLNKELGKVQEIEVFAQIAQYVAESDKFQRYAVQCLATFWTT